MQKSQAIINKILASNMFRKDAAIFASNGDGLIDLVKRVSDNEIMDFLLSNKEEIIIDGGISQSEIQNTIDNISNIDNLIDWCEFNGFILNKTDLKFLENNFFEGKERIVPKIIKQSIKSNKNFVNIAKMANDYYKELSIWNLYIGAFFLNGIGIDGTLINSPLIFIPVQVDLSSAGVIKVKRIESENIVINDKINFYLSNTYNINFQNISDNEVESITWVNKYVDWLKPILNTDNIIQGNFEEFNSNTSIDFKVKQFFCLMLADPSGGILLRDYETIVKSEIDPFDSSDIISNQNEYIQEIIEKDNLIEMGRPLNIYQKYAVKSALNENTLIFGPPGTGKSEVIANIVANIVADNKNVLMVSEKKAALDVLEERIGELKYICLSAHDTRDKNHFYGRIKDFQSILTSLNATEGFVQNSGELYEKLKSYIEITKKIKECNFGSLSFDQVINIVDNIDKNKFKFYQQHNILKQINNYLKINNLTLNENLFIKLSKLSKLINYHLDDLKFLINSNVEINNISLLQQFVNLYNSAKDKNTVIYNFIKLNKLKDASLLSKIKSDKIDFNINNIFETINELITINLDNIKINEIDCIRYFDFSSLEELNEYLLTDFIYDNISSLGYSNQLKLNSQWENYINFKKEYAEKTSKGLLIKYITKFLKWYETIDDESKEEFRELFKQTNLKRPKPVNVFIKRFYKCLKKLFPIWVLNPIQTCVVCPCEPSLFDYGIFDEASQMFLENAYPLIYRSEICIVAGDDKQLQPTSFFMSNSETDDLDDIDGNIVSLFEKANTELWPKFHLKNHYRSASADLIDFSNEYIYNRSLETATKANFNKQSVFVKTVNGRFENRKNIEESIAILEYLKDNYNEDDLRNKKKIIIITFNLNQAIYIENQFNCNYASNMVLKCAYEQDLIIFKNLENIQGAEGDEVYISVAYGPNSNGDVRQMFGPLSRFGGENRLNVAITRAKYKMVIFKSLFYNQIIPGDNKHTLIFQRFIEWCDNFEKNNYSNIRNDNYANNSINNMFLNDVISCLKNELPSNYEYITNYNIGSTKLDIAIKHDNILVLGISLFDIENKSTKETIENLDKMQFLCDRGYIIYRINSIDWKLKQNEIITEIKAKLNN